MPVFPRVSYLLLLILTGCNRHPATYPVDGTVVYADGSPVKGGIVEMMMTGPDGKAVNARGAVDAHGKFSLSTFEPGDGAMPGEYRAIVISEVEPFVEDLTKYKPGPMVADRFRSYDTSGLEFTILPEPNHLDVRVEQGK